SPSLDAIAPATLPLSSEQIDYPAIEAAHQASMLRSPAEVVAWRASRPPDATASSSEPVVPVQPLPPDAVHEPIETVILRRGSARRFRRDPISAAELATILVCATT